MGGSGTEGRKVSHYRIQDRLGAGGMGEVYLARDLSLGRLAAIKLLPPGVDPSFRSRLLREAKSAARLQHPGIATLFESSGDGDEAYIAMEYVRGETLRVLLRAGSLPAPKALGIAANLLEALGHAHAVGILHRDIKPENVMVTEDKTAKLLDFGLAKPVTLAIDPSRRASPNASLPFQAPDSMDRGGSAASDGVATVDVPLEATLAPASVDLSMITEAGHVVGTPGYMSPEQIRGEPLTPASDLFSIGCVLYEMLTADPAFPGKTRIERLSAVFRGPAPSVRPDLASPQLRAVLDRALAREATARFQSAARFLVDLRQTPEWRDVPSVSNTLAILEFSNASSDTEANWIGAALSSGLVARLARDPEIRVVPAAKVAAMASALRDGERQPTPLDLGLRLSCRWVLHGTYRRTPHSLRVTTHLTDVPVADIVSSNEFVIGTDGVLEAEGRICDALRESLRLQERPLETRSAGTANSKAYELYARGRQITMRLDKSVLEQAIGYLEEAVAIDPDFAEAHAALGRVRALRSAFAEGDSDLEAALQSARNALRLDPNSADAHYTMAYVAGRRGDLNDSTPHMRRAMELAPGDPIPPYMLGGNEGRLGRREEAIALLQTAIRINPTFGMAWINLGWLHMELGRSDEAIWCLSQAVALEGVSSGAPAAGCAGYLGECLRRLRRLDEAREKCLAGLAATERTNHIYRDTFRGACLCSLGRVALDQGDIEAATAAFGQAITHLQGRPAAGGGGFLLVQALAGLARAERSEDRFREALDLLANRQGYKFSWVWGGCSEDFTLLELASTARALGHQEEFEDLIQRARDAHVAEVFLEGLV